MVAQPPEDGWSTLLTFADSSKSITQNEIPGDRNAGADTFDAG
jgi:hypothetical protein